MKHRQLLPIILLLLLCACSNEKVQVSFRQDIDVSNETIQFTCKVTGSVDDYLALLEDCDNMVSESVNKIREEGIINVPNIPSRIFTAPNSSEFYNNLSNKKLQISSFEFKTELIPITKNY